MGFAPSRLKPLLLAVLAPVASFELADSRQRWPLVKSRGVNHYLAAVAATRLPREPACHAACHAKMEGWRRTLTGWD